MEQYISRCIDSLLISEGLEDLEVLVINDGSKDKSSEIAHQYAQRYPESIFVIDKVNGNYGSCINTALKVATGKYIKILDADDYFNCNDFNLLIKRLHSCNTDVILTNHTIISNEGFYLWKHPYNNFYQFTLDKKCPAYFTMHSIAYRTNLLRESSYVQSEGISYTDQEWIFYPMIYAKEMQYFDLNVYQYCMDREGQTMDPKVFAKGLPMLYKILMRILSHIEGINFKERSAKQDYIKMQVLRQAEIIYMQEIVYGINVSQDLESLDSYLKNKFNILYEELSPLRIGFCHYVNYYRKNRSVISNFNKSTLSIQIKLRRIMQRLVSHIKVFKI